MEGAEGVRCGGVVNGMCGCGWVARRMEPDSPSADVCARGGGFWKGAGSALRRWLTVLRQGGFAKCYELTDVETGAVWAGKIVEKRTLAKYRAKEKVGARRASWTIGAC